MLDNFRRLFLSDVFLALNGSTAYAASGGKVYAVPARLLVELPSYKIIAFGDDAREVEHAGLGRSGIILPCRDTEIYDERGAEVFLHSLFRVVLGPGFLLKPRVWLALPSRVTPFMREVWSAVVLGAGARDVMLVDQNLALAAGAGLPYKESHGYVVGSLAEEGVSLSLVAFGHVQQEVWLPAYYAQTEKKQLALLEDGWRKLLESVSPEFLADIQREGLLLQVNDDSTEWAQRYSRALGVPVAVVGQSTPVQGLRQIAEEANV